jgi:hypothetical protein
MATPCHTPLHAVGHGVEGLVVVVVVVAVRSELPDLKKVFQETISRGFLIFFAVFTARPFALGLTSSNLKLCAVTQNGLISRLIQIYET